ncbi:interleukin-5 receptor subunit alpha isoform X2 [Pseudophryne corroboree]
MPGVLRLLLVLSQVAAFHCIQPPQDLQVGVPMLGNVVLSWKHNETSEINSLKYWIKLETTEKLDEVRVSENHYTCPMLALHSGLKVQVAAMKAVPQDSVEESETSKWLSQELPPYSGEEGTAAKQLSCQINIEPSNEGVLLRCTWLPGEKAPLDTQYYLYYRHDTVTEKCQEYMTEPGRVRQTGCQILLHRLLINEPKQILVYINGSSRSLEIQAMDKVFMSSDIEVLPPVRNVAYEKVGNKGLTWKMPIPVLSEICFSYEVNIRSEDNNETVTVSSSSFWRNTLQKPTSKHYVRVRAVGQEPCWSNTKPYSPWTENICIGDSEIDGSSRDMLAITVSVCLTVSCIAVFVLCVRFWRTIFPRIPKPKNDLKEAFQNTQNEALMRCNSWDNEEVISYIVEMTGSDKYNVTTDYTQVGEYPGSGTYKTA